MPSNMFELWREEYKMARVPDTPCVLDISHIARNIVTCGHQKACEDRAKDLYQQLLLKESRALMAVLPDTKICHGCSRYSMRTHRCSRCRVARYCSKDCLNQDWRQHRIRCRDFTRPGIEKLYATKKLGVEDRKTQSKDCFMQLCHYDPLLGSAQVAAAKKMDEVD